MTNFGHFVEASCPVGRCDWPSMAKTEQLRRFEMLGWANLSEDDFDDAEDTRNSLFLDALVEYMAVVGKIISADELVVGLPVRMQDFDIEDAPRALRRLGYVCKLGHAKRIDQLTLPVCVKLNDGSFVTVITQDGNSLKIVNPDVEGGYREVAYNLSLIHI